MIDTREKVRAFIINNFYVANAGALGDDVSLLGSGIIDSTGMLEIIELIETEFGIQVEEAEVVPDNLDTIGRIVAFIRRKTAA